jgi:glycosylphosphatidylinositol transamidase (GPIT) subunit GPI8
MIFLAILLLITAIAFAQKAFIFSSSVGYYNYRQNANALKIYETIKGNGLEDKDIILGFPENVGCCEKNPEQGVVSFYDNENRNINKNVEVDLKFSSISASTILDSLRMKYP